MKAIILQWFIADYPVPVNGTTLLASRQMNHY